MIVMIRVQAREVLLVLLAGACADCVGGTFSTVPFHEEPVQPNSALIYIYRQHAFAGGGSAWEVALDDIVEGQIRANAYFTIHAAPGTHWLRVGDVQSFPLVVLPVTGLVL